METLTRQEAFVTTVATALEEAMWGAQGNFPDLSDADRQHGFTLALARVLETMADGITFSVEDAMVCEAGRIAAGVSGRLSVATV